MDLRAESLHQDNNPVTSAYQERRIPFTAGDGMELNLINIHGPNAPRKGPVLLCHGAGVRANIFRAPIQTTIVDALIEQGYDVWLENWRGSIEIPANRWSLDQVALYDHPKAVEKIIEETGAESIKAIVHCQGSTSFTMSAIAGLVPQVNTIISNAVSLHPIVPDISLLKLKVTVPIVKLLTPYLNPHWGKQAPGLVPKLIKLLVRMTHHECDNDVCKMVSFTYGTGWPTLWAHKHLDEVTHEWISEEFKEVPLRFFEQIKRCVIHGNLINLDSLSGLPRDYAAVKPKTQARFAFFAGANNICFLPQSQQKTFEYFDAIKPGFHSLHIIPDYGHLDIFLGKNAATDVFPLMLQQLDA